jgi:hypothetical protein
LTREQKTKEKKICLLNNNAFVNSDSKSVPSMPDGKGGALRGTKPVLDRREKTPPQVRVKKGSKKVGEK